MNKNEFTALTKARFAACESILKEKNDQYGEDRLSGFKTNSDFVKIAPEQLASMKLYNHMKNVFDMVNVGSVSGKDLEAFQSEVTDTINYLVLLEGLVSESAGAAPVTKTRKSKKAEATPVETDEEPTLIEDESNDSDTDDLTSDNLNIDLFN